MALVVTRSGGFWAELLVQLDLSCLEICPKSSVHTKQRKCCQWSYKSYSPNNFLSLLQYLIDCVNYYVIIASLSTTL